MAWLSVWSKVQTCIWPSCCHCHSLSLASVKSRLVLPFWYRLTWVVPEKGPLNVCVFPLELCPKFWTPTRSCCQQNSLAIELVVTHDGCSVVAVYYTFLTRRPNALTPLLRLFVDLLYNLFLYSCAVVNRILIAIACRMVCLH